MVSYWYFFKKNLLSCDYVKTYFRILSKPLLFVHFTLLTPILHLYHKIPNINSWNFCMSRSSIELKWIGRTWFETSKLNFAQGSNLCLWKKCKRIIKISYLEHVFSIEFFDPKGVSYKQKCNEQIGAPMACQRIIT